MKKLSAWSLSIFLILTNFLVLAQNTDLNIFKITNSKVQTEVSICGFGKQYYNQTCVNSHGLTIDFKGPYFTPNLKVISKNIDPFTIGSYVYADFIYGSVSPMINNAIDHSKRYQLSIANSQTETFSITNSTHSPTQIFLQHLNSKPEYPTLDGTIYRHTYDYWFFDTTFTLNQDVTNSILLAPGWYDIEILGVRVPNILVFKDCQTRIKAGILKINSISPWTLYSKNGNQKLYSSSQSKMLEFPTGIYQLEINGISQQIEIKDGETLQIGDTSAPQTQKLNTEAHAIWDMQIDPTLKGLTGEVTMQVPKEVQFNTHMEFYETGDTKKPVASWFGNNKAKLMPGLYDILIDKKYIIKNVPVEQGKQTRLKMGVLQWSGYGSIELEDANHQKFSYGAPFKKVLPVGTYTIVGRKQKPNTFVITDGKLTEF